MTVRAVMRMASGDGIIILIPGCIWSAAAVSKGYRNGSTIHKISQVAGIDPQAIFLPIQTYARAVFPEFEVALQAGEDSIY